MDFDIKADVLGRFLRYVQIDTQSSEHSDSFPSTAKQLELLRLLRDELQGLGLANARLDEHGYVMATIPSTLPDDHAQSRPHDWLFGPRRYLARGDGGQRQAAGD